MVGRRKSKQARSEIDRISELPNLLISQILSHLPTKDAVKTSVLSTAWRSLWLWVPKLELDSTKFPDLEAFAKFGDRFFNSDRISCVEKLDFTIDENVDPVDDDDAASYLTSWIDSAVKRKVQNPHVRCSSDEHLYQMPLSFYTCETLVSLELYKMKMVNAEFVSLPCLKTMHLKHVLYPNETTFERLVSSCPVLEELKMIVARNDLKLFRVQSRSLKKLVLIRASPFQLGFVSGVVIDAPLLYMMCIFDNVSESFLVNNLEPNAKLALSLDFSLLDFDEASISSRRSRIRSFLPGITRVASMTIDADTFKVIHDYSRLEALPPFRYMTRMSVSLSVLDLICLPTFLESCPSLEILIVRSDDYERMRYEEINLISFSSVPECFLSSLKFVDLDIEISGYAEEVKLVKYFLENSAMLKTLTLHVNYPAVDYDIFKELLKITRRSATCQVVVV